MDTNIIIGVFIFLFLLGQVILLMLLIYSDAFEKLKELLFPGCDEGKHKFKAFLLEHIPPTKEPSITFRYVSIDELVNVLNVFSKNTYEIRCEVCGCKPPTK